MSALYDVHVQGQPKGEVFKHSGRWRWQRPNSKGMETYPRVCRLISVRQHIARLCHVQAAEVKLTKKPWTPV
jgi:hypothetical protein